MKKTYSVLAVALALFAFLPVANAQPWQEKQGFMYRKSISQPTTEGIYTITLESFTKGELKLEAAPCDVVLVLDMSGSMRWPMGQDVSGSTSDERKKAMQDAVKAFIEAIDDNDKYLPDDGDPNTPRVFRQKRLGNKIGMIKFANSASPVIELTGLGGNTSSTALNVDNVTGKNSLINAINTIGTPTGATYADAGMNMAYNWLTASSLGADRKIRTCILFTDGAPGSDNYWTSSTVSSRNTTWNTANNVINKANQIKNIGTEANKIISRVYTVSIFAGTKNREYIDVYLGKTSSNWEGVTNMGTYETWNSSSIWSNGDGNQVAGPVPVDKGPSNFAFATISSDELKNIFERIADENGGSEAQIGSATVSQVDVISASFALPDNATDNDIKVYTARYIGDVDGTPTFSTNEVLARSNTDKYTKITKTIVGGQEQEVIEHDVDVDDAINWGISNSEGGDISQGAKPDRISVTGFDYANLWCGTDETVTTGDYAGLHQGYKLIVKIPIRMDPGAVGGPSLDTNGPGSGFIVNGQLWAEFTPPQVSLPVNIHIQKEGLDVGESAKFTIQRKIATDSDWTYVTSVFVTRTTEAEATPMVKVVGLPATDDSDPANDYIYRVVEDNWSWAYKLTAIKDAEGNSIGVLSERAATTDDLDVNPFIFVNTKKTNIDVKVKNAESKAYNEFLPGNTEGSYVDSKPRTTTTTP